MTELIVDNFAGGDGASTGIYLATGRHPDIAIDYDPDAIRCHTLNHPSTRHYLESVWDVDPTEACAGRPVGLAWFSPDCTHFSRAKSGAKVSDDRRGLAWVVIRWAKAVKPLVIILENVEEFRTWGPLDDDGRPDKARQGETFGQWLQELESLGYVAEFRVLHAHHYGAPTIRKRLFMIARCDGKPIVWPEPTHGEGLLPYRTARECIDWSMLGKSITERAKPLSSKTLQRIADGRKQHGERFIVAYYGKEEGYVSLDQPLRTIVTKDRFALIDGDTMRMFQPHELLVAQGFPADYRFDGLTKTAQVRLIGNSVSPPLVAAIVRSNYP